jgi:hypothetical protein
MAWPWVAGPADGTLTGPGVSGVAAECGDGEVVLGGGLEVESINPESSPIAGRFGDPELIGAQPAGAGSGTGRPRQPVLVVEVGNPGAEIALELAGGHQMWLSGRDNGHISPGLHFVGPLFLYARSSEQIHGDGRDAAHAAEAIAARTRVRTASSQGPVGADQRSPATLVRNLRGGDKRG